jgi:hypothetical protein
MEIWDGIKKTLSTAVPILANAILPGTGGLASSLISGVLGCEDSPEAIQQSIRPLTPAQITALKKVEMDHRDRLIELSIKQDEVQIKAIDDARQREMAVVKATGKKDWNLYILAYAIVLGFSFIVGLMIFKKLPAESMGPVNQLFGFLGAGFMGVINYFFGSSKSSADKTALMASTRNG